MPFICERNKTICPGEFPDLCFPLVHLQVTHFYQVIGADATQPFNGKDIEPGTWAPRGLKSEIKYSEKGFSDSDWNAGKK